MQNSMHVTEALNIERIVENPWVKLAARGSIIFASMMLGMLTWLGPTWLSSQVSQAATDVVAKNTASMVTEIKNIGEGQNQLTTRVYNIEIHNATADAVAVSARQERDKQYDQIMSALSAQAIVQNQLLQQQGEILGQMKTISNAH